MQDGRLNKVVKPSKSSVQPELLAWKKNGWLVLQIVKFL